MQAHPVFLDVEYQTNLISPEILREAIKKHPDVKHLVLVHYGGQAAQLNTIMEVCRQNNIKIIEDAAHALPAKHEGKMIGSFGNIACYSFYANKTITTGEGGMLTTNDEEIYKRVKTMRLHGISKDIWDRFTAKVPSWEYDVVEAGYKYNMPDICAAIGLGQLEQAELFRKERQNAVEFYLRNLADVECLDLPVSNVPMEDHAWHIFPVVLNEKAGISRNSLINKMAEQGIGTSVHYKPLHRMTYYKNKYQLDPQDFPNAEKTWKGNLSLPLYPFMKNDDLDYICNTVKNLIKKQE